MAVVAAGLSIVVAALGVEAARMRGRRHGRQADAQGGDKQD
jgi:hypothetical protein